PITIQFQCTYAMSPCIVPAPTVNDPLSLHDALPISVGDDLTGVHHADPVAEGGGEVEVVQGDHGGHAQAAHQPQHVELVAQVEVDRKSTRLNSSHVKISYAVFCLKKKTISTSRIWIQ